MEADFWKIKWQKNEIAFHGSEANPLLVKHFGALALPEGSRVFVPLCGKSVDMAWLVSQGYRVAGAEWVEDAVRQFFSELGVEPQVSVEGKLKRYSAANIDLFAGDVFDLSPAVLGPVNAVYDRAALVALPEERRARYAAHVMNLTGMVPHLTICYEYDQARMEGPPFSISPEEIQRHYGGSYETVLLECAEVPGGLKGQCAARESVWYIKKKES